MPCAAPAGPGDGDSGADSPTARPCPVLLPRPSVAGMIRNAPSAARTSTTPAKTSLRWADERSIAAALLPAPQRAQPERGRAAAARRPGRRCRAPVSPPPGRPMAVRATRPGARRAGPSGAWAEPNGVPPRGMPLSGAGARVPPRRGRPFPDCAAVAAAGLAAAGVAAARVAAGVAAATEQARGNGPGLLLLRSAAGLASGARRPGPGLERHDERAVAAVAGPADRPPRSPVLGPRRQVQAVAGCGRPERRSPRPWPATIAAAPAPGLTDVVRCAPLACPRPRRLPRRPCPGRAGSSRGRGTGRGARRASRRPGRHDLRGRRGCLGRVAPRPAGTAGGGEPRHPDGGRRRGCSARAPARRGKRRPVPWSR